MCVDMVWHEANMMIGMGLDLCVACSFGDNVVTMCILDIHVVLSNKLVEDTHRHLLLSVVDLRCRYLCFVCDIAISVPSAVSLSGVVPLSHFQNSEFPFQSSASPRGHSRFRQITCNEHALYKGALVVVCPRGRSHTGCRLPPAEPSSKETVPTWWRVH